MTTHALPPRNGPSLLTVIVVAFLGACAVRIALGLLELIA